MGRIKRDWVADQQTPTDEELMLCHVAGEPKAFEILFARYAPPLMALFARERWREVDPGDLLQQTFLQLHRARGDFRADAPLRPWLYTIALNVKRQQMRRLGRRPERGVDEAFLHQVPIADDAGLPQERMLVAQNVRAAVAKLPDSQRQVIELQWFAGLSLAEVAVRLGAKEGAVKVRAHRAYARLRQLMSGEPDPEMVKHSVEGV